ncbi:MAG: hypothetical protein AAF702_40875 [Chloroflexota bacterium]
MADNSVVVRINNATSPNVRISWLSPTGQKWFTLRKDHYTDIEVQKGRAGNFLIQVVEE